MIPAIEKLPRMSLGHYPTPIMEARALSRAVGGPRLLIKRDDLSGLALGGNKCRHLEFLMGHVLEQRHDVILCGGGSKRSNYGIQLLAAANKVGVKVRFYMRDDPSSFSLPSGNILLRDLIGSDITWVKVERSEEERQSILSRMLTDEAELRRQGHSPYVMQTIYIDESPVEQAGWVRAADEMNDQLRQMGIKADYLILPNGQGGTQSGLVVGAKYLGTPFKVIGICIMFPKERQVQELVRMTNETARFLGMDLHFSPDEMEVYDDYRGEKYGVVTPECVEAIKVVARTEGIFLDPIYTGKAMAGLIDLVRRGRLTAKDTVVFIHTGGIPDLFLCGQEVLRLGA